LGEYFTKWVEAKPITNISSATINNFFWQNNICSYVIPRHIIVNNAKQFDNDMFKDFCHHVGTKVAFMSIYHPQSNGAVEWANTLIFEVIKKILEGEKKGKWAEVMLKIVWSHNTTVSRATNFTPFRLLFRAETVLPEEIKHLRTTIEVPPCPNDAKDKDLLELDMLKVVVNLQKYQDKTWAWRDPKVKLREFNIGNLVLLWSPHSESSDKLESKWARPYVVAEKSRPGAYRLSDSQGKMLEHS
jgi:hypothetical protein